MLELIILALIITIVWWLTWETLLLLFIMGFRIKSINPFKAIKHRLRCFTWVGNNFLIVSFIFFLLIMSIIHYKTTIHDLHNQIDQLKQNTTIIIKTEK